MRVGLSYDLKDAVPLESASPEDALEEYDSIETVELISRAIESGGHTVIKLGGGRDFLTNIMRENVDLVFNIAEGLGNYRSREAQVPSVLEMLGIPYTGSDPQCLAICLDKPLTKKLVATAGVPTPSWRVISSPEQLGEASWANFPFPAIIKPACEGSSKGIRNGSLVSSPSDTIETASRLLLCYQQPLMVEEFISGDEVTVGIVSNSPPQVLGMMRVLPRHKVDHFVYSLEVKRDWQNLVDYESPVQLAPETLAKLTESSLKTFAALGCRDFARLDFRISARGEPYFIEINPLPGLGTHSDLVIMALKLGWRYEALIGTILDAVLRRYPQFILPAALLHHTSG